MIVELYKSKIHRAVVTQAELHYIGSVTIDENLMDAAQIFDGELVHIINVNNGARWITYALPGKRGSGVICLNGGGARLANVGDIVIIIAYAQMELEQAKKFQPAIIFPNEKNKLA